MSAQSQRTDSAAALKNKREIQAQARVQGMPLTNAERKVVLDKLIAYSVEKPDYASVATTLKNEHPAWPCSHTWLREKVCQQP